MITKLTIGGRELAFTANAATPFRYKQLFHEDILQLLQSNSKAEENQVLLSDTITKLAYIMNAQAEKKDMNCISFDDFMTWLEAQQYQNGNAFTVDLYGNSRGTGACWPGCYQNN